MLRMYEHVQDGQINWHSPQRMYILCHLGPYSI